MKMESGKASTRCDVENTGPFAALDPRIRADLADICVARRLQPGKTLVADGEEADFVGCVTQGILKMQKTLLDGRQHIVGLLMPGDMFGRVFDGASWFAIEAATEAEVVTFRRGRFEALLSDWPDLERLMILNILDELDSAREWMMVLSGHKVTERLAGFLLMLCRRRGGGEAAFCHLGDSLDIRIPLSRIDLASLLGTRPESISRAAHALAEEGVLNIKTPYLFEVSDLDALIAASGNEDLAECDEIHALRDGMHR
jgi:CRP/FNR family transcriptional regulator